METAPAIGRLWPMKTKNMRRDLTRRIGPRQFDAVRGADTRSFDSDRNAFFLDMRNKSKNLATTVQKSRAFRIILCGYLGESAASPANCMIAVLSCASCVGYR
jgi:hypothetical protein